MVSHIKVTKRAEGLGLGESTLDPAIAQSLNADDWWKNSVGDTLAKLAGAKKKTKKEKKNKDDKKKKKVYTDEELFEATGGARFGMRAQRRQDGKWKRAESNISEQDEQEALKKVEWDGRTAPKVVLSSEDKKSSSKKRKSTEEEVPEATPDEKSERKRQKKQRRKEEESTDQSSTDKKKKKAKKSKTSKEQ
jgi:Pin2-interacting protein X1